MVEPTEDSMLNPLQSDWDEMHKLFLCEDLADRRIEWPVNWYHVLYAFAKKEGRLSM